MNGSNTMGMRFIPVALLMGAAALFVHGRGLGDQLPPRKNLASFPDQIGEWSGTRLNIRPQVLDILGPGEYSEQTYETPARIATSTSSSPMCRINVPETGSIRRSTVSRVRVGLRSRRTG